MAGRCLTYLSPIYKVGNANPRFIEVDHHAGLLQEIFPQKKLKLIPLAFTNHTNVQQTVDPDHAYGGDILLLGDEALPSPESECLPGGTHMVLVP